MSDEAEADRTRMSHDDRRKFDHRPLIGCQTISRSAVRVVWAKPGTASVD